MSPTEESKGPRYQHVHRSRDLHATDDVIELVSKRWTLLIISELLFGPRRFSDLRSGLSRISAKVLISRLKELTKAGVVTHRRLSAPGRPQVYELTQWGCRVEPVIQEMARWTALSDTPNPIATLTNSPAGLMISLRTMFDGSRAVGTHMRIGFSFPKDSFTVTVADATFTAKREKPKDCSVVFDAPNASGIAATIFLGVAPIDAGVAVTGDAHLVRGFMDVIGGQGRDR